MSSLRTTMTVAFGMEIDALMRSRNAPVFIAQADNTGITENFAYL